MNFIDLDIRSTKRTSNSNADRMAIAEPSRAVLRQLDADLSRVQQELGDLMVDIKRAKEFGAPADMEEWIFLLALMESRVVRINHALWSLGRGGQNRRDPQGSGKKPSNL